MIRAGAGLAAVPVIAGLSSGLARADSSSSVAATGNLGAKTARAWGARSSGGSMVPLTVERRPVGPNDVQMKILYCGVCHSDIHMIDND